MKHVVDKSKEKEKKHKKDKKDKKDKKEKKTKKDKKDKRSKVERSIYPLPEQNLTGSFSENVI